MPAARGAIQAGESPLPELCRTGRAATCAARRAEVAIGPFGNSTTVFTAGSGLGTASAALIDASPIRGSLVPSSNHHAP